MDFCTNFSSFTCTVSSTDRVEFHLSESKPHTLDQGTKRRQSVVKVVRGANWGHFSPRSGKGNVTSSYSSRGNQTSVPRQTFQCSLTPESHDLFLRPSRPGAPSGTSRPQSGRPLSDSNVTISASAKASCSA